MGGRVRIAVVTLTISAASEGEAGSVVCQEQVSDIAVQGRGTAATDCVFAVSDTHGGAGMTLETVYRLYDEYVTRLHEALSEPPAGPVADAYRVKRLSRCQFETVWRSWGRIPGSQTRWAARFSAGHEADAASIRNRFNVAADEGEFPLEPRLIFRSEK